jgi:hypothetical protein
MEIIMKRMLRNAFCGVGFWFLLLTFAEAQVGLVTAQIDGVQEPAPSPIFSNCDAICSKYSHIGYAISGTGISPGTGQTIAVGFTTKKAVSFTKALTPLVIYTGNGGANHGNVTAMLLKDNAGEPGLPIATLVQVGKLNDKSFKVIEYQPKKPLKLKAKTQYWLCLEETTTDVQALWADNILKDTTSPMYYNDDASCKAPMTEARGAIAPAYAVF